MGNHVHVLSRRTQAACYHSYTVEELGKEDRNVHILIQRITVHLHSLAARDNITELSQSIGDRDAVPGPTLLLVGLQYQQVQ